MELAAVVMVPGNEELAAVHEAGPRIWPNSNNSLPLDSSRMSFRMPILGNDLLRSWTDRVRGLGVKSLWITPSPSDETGVFSALARLAKDGIERLLLINLKSYAEMDLGDLLRFHRDSGNSMTEAQDAHGPLGVSLVDRPAVAKAARQSESSPSAPASGRPRYQFRGYAKRILSTRERQELVADALTGACAMRPLGTQIRENVWIGEGVKFADSARVVGPTYIGARTKIGAGVTIGPFASVESDCVVDCGTTIERSTVLPYTYLAPGLLVRDAMVDGGYLEHLRWGAVANLESARLGSRIRRPIWRKAARSETASNVFPAARGSFAWDYVPSAATSQPWLQVQL